MRLSPCQMGGLNAVTNWYLSIRRSKKLNFILDGAGGTGKALPLDALILTPTGFVRNETLCVGDLVISEKGEPIEVLGVYDQTNLQMYKVTFKDGSSVSCCEDHLWEIQTKKLRASKRYDIRATKDLLDFKTERFVPCRGKIETEYKYYIPLVEPIKFTEKEFEIDPYTLGYIIGNGSSSSDGKMLISSSAIIDSTEILTYLDETTILNVRKHTETVTTIAFTKDTRVAYKSLELQGIKSIYKFIPKEYLIGSVEQRKALLAGLLDSDGCCAANRCRFSTSSKQLALDVTDLVRSLGGTASFSKSDRLGKVNIEYTLQIRLPFNPFKLKRKAAGYKVIPSDNVKTIVNIEKLGIESGRCILVNSERHLYVVNDYTLTHNTYLVKRILANLPKVKPLILTYTNEALEQIRSKTGEEYTYMTVYKSLGLRPTTKERDLRFESFSLPSHWNHFNLVIVDEASMLAQWEIDLLLAIGIPILWVGHEKQLPPVDNNRLTTDKCISPVFHMGFETYTLKTPMRNGGKLWQFIAVCEKIVDYPLTEVPNTFDIKGKALNEYLASAKEDLSSGQTKFVTWTRNSVGKYNDLARRLIFGEIADSMPYLPGDKVIFISPTYYLFNPESLSEIDFFQLIRKDAILSVYTNTKATVVNVTVLNIRWRKDLTFHCYLIELKLDSGNVIKVVEPIVPEHAMKIINEYEHNAWGTQGKAREEWYKKRNSVMSLLGSVEIKGKDRVYHKNLLHFYAATSYRLQGSTIAKVIAINSNISSCPNLYEAAKHRYVAVSRTSTELMFYRGVTI